MGKTDDLLQGNRFATDLADGAADTGIRMLNVGCWIFT